MNRELPNDPNWVPRPRRGCFRLISGVVVTAVVALLSAGSATAQTTTALPRVNVSGASMVIGSKVFVPRGVNYLRMEGSEPVTLDVGKYDPVKAEDMFTSLRVDGYNHNRVFIRHGNWVDAGISGPLMSTTPFNSAYLDNVVDYIKRGARNKIYTSVVLQDIPTNCYFYTLIQGGTRCATDYTVPNVFGTNAFFMDPGYVAAKAKYMELFAAEMVTRLGSDITAILNYSAANEANFDASQAPFTNWDASTYSLNGKTYRMDVAADRQEAADAAFVNYSLLVKAGLRRGDPNAKFTVGFYTNYAVNKIGFDGLAYCAGPAPCKVTVNYPDFRYPARVSKVLTILDMAELHFYPRPLTMSMVPGSGTYTVAKDLATVEMNSTTMTKKPVIIGEWGAFRSFYPTVSQAASAMKAAQKAACALGADGYDFWTYDTVEQVTGAGVQELYTLTQDSERINQDLYPLGRPNPCS